MELYPSIKFGNVTLRSDRPFLIAEAGVNYENDMSVAMAMIEEAAKAGADAIKFQSYKADKIASKYSPSYWDLSKEPTTSQHALFKKYDLFNEKEYAALAVRAKECGIIFMSTPFDFDFADSLAPCMPLFKIASADLTNLPFLRHCAKKGKPMILSVGASTIGEIDDAVKTVRNAGNEQIALLHCVLSYPTDPKNANLRIIDHLKATYPECIIGYSDHVPPHFDCITLTAAWTLGARIIEKHFTLDKTKPGNDHYHAMDPADIRNFRQQCDFVTNLLGQRKKEVLPCEKESRKQARRSLVVARAIKAGEAINEKDLMIKRPGTGIEPKYIDLILGKAPRVDLREDEILQWNMFMNVPANER